VKNFCHKVKIDALDGQGGPLTVGQPLGLTVGPDGGGDISFYTSNDCTTGMTGTLTFPEGANTHYTYVRTASPTMCDWDVHLTSNAGIGGLNSCTAYDLDHVIYNFTGLPTTIGFEFEDSSFNPISVPFEVKANAAITGCAGGNITFNSTGTPTAVVTFGMWSTNANEAVTITGTPTGCMISMTPYTGDPNYKYPAAFLPGTQSVSGY
jgi:hypothetical protein